MQSCDSVGNEVDVDNVDPVGGPEWQHWQPGQKHECLDHVELRRFRKTAVSQYNAGTKDGLGGVGKQHSHHVLTKLFCSRVGIVIGTIPFDGAIFGYHLVSASSRDSNGAYLAKAAQAV